jgi:hypothetical protein
MKTIFFIFTLFIFTSCTHINPAGLSDAFNEGSGSIELSVNAIADDSIKSQTYGLFSGDKSIDEKDLFYKEYRKLVNNSLEKAGFQNTESKKTGDIAIFLTYGIGEPVTRTEAYAIPIFGQTGYSSATTTGHLYGGNYSGTTTFNPQYGVTGTTTGYSTTTSYTRFLILDAVDFRSGKPEPRWKVIVASTGPSDDLRRVFPALALAAGQFAGKNPGQTLNFEIQENDSLLQEIKQKPIQGNSKK